MIAHLHGTILEKHPNQVIVDAGGVGYDVTVPISTFTALPGAGAEVRLRIHTHVREAAISLYGFMTGQEKTLFEKHPYRLDASGTVDSIQRMTEGDLREYYRHLLVPENMVLTVVGDVDEKEVLRAIRKGFGDLKKGDFSPPAVPQEPPLEKTRKRELLKAKEQAHFVLGFLGTSIHHKDRYALEILDAALSGQGGRLFSELRDKESLAYALAFVGQPNYDPGYIGVYMGTHPKKLEGAIEAVLRELKKVREGGLTEGEVERAKRYLIGNFEIGLQTNGAQANQMSLDELYGLGFDHYQKYPQQIQRVTKDEVNRAARKYFTLEAYAIAIVRPPSDTQE